MRLTTQLVRLQKVINRVGPRYTPQLNIDVPVSFVFEGLGRTNNFIRQVEAGLGGVRRAFSGAATTDARQEARDPMTRLEALLRRVTGKLRPIRVSPLASVDFLGAAKAATQGVELARQCFDILRQVAQRENPAAAVPTTLGTREKFERERYYFHELRGALAHLDQVLSSEAAAAARNPRLVLVGSAGSGKTHLLCDIARRRLEQHLPTLIFLAEEFPDHDPIRAMMRILGIGGPRRSFLERLDRMGRRRRAPVLILIDAANEARLKVRWHQLFQLTTYNGLAVALSVRSGFERDVIPARVGRVCTWIEHKGFAHRGWEAVTTFFKAYRIRLPDVPLVFPEFENPLFLKIFCEAHQGTEEVPRGHEGATRIFERYVKKQGSKVVRDLGIVNAHIRGKHVVWDLIVKDRLAAWMAEQGHDRIPEQEALVLVNEILPGRASDVLRSLERHWILTKIPRHAERGVRRRYDYRFPYQKFSDHLIVRYLLNKYLDSNHPQQSFLPGTTLGNILIGRNYGLTEALAVQVPERLRGRDLVAVAPAEFAATFQAQESFLESLLWRRLKRDEHGQAVFFDMKSSLAYVNNHIIISSHGHQKLLDTLLAVAIIPGHPFNALLLHHHLERQNMPERDAWWLPFLHDRATADSPVFRLITWGWEGGDKSHISDESIELGAIALAWFLASSNRFVRDRSTKALVALLVDRLPVLLRVLKRFRGVNDPYVGERLYAVAYGCVLRCVPKQTEELRALGEWVYQNVFAPGSRPPTHILLRDYARGVILGTLHQGIGLQIDQRRIDPPYGSEFPRRISSARYLEEKYYEPWSGKTDDRGYVDIWMSVMSGGDFARYVIGTNFDQSCWTSQRLGEPVRPTRKEIHDKFMKELSRPQRVLWDRVTACNLRRWLTSVTPKPGAVNGKTHAAKPIHNLDRERQSAELTFKRSLTRTQSRIYRTVVVPHQAAAGKSENSFDLSRVQRWVFRRVIELGWRPELHGSFDRRLNYSRGDRTDHKAERIGKKYQWIAYHECLARLGDNYGVLEDRWRRVAGRYEGPWQLGARDIDPSLLIKTISEKEGTLGLWWCPTYGAWARMHDDRRWLRRTSDLPRIESVLSVADPSGGQWFTLEGFFRCQEPHPADEERYERSRRELWIMVRSYLVRRRGASSFWRWAKQQNFWGGWMPEAHEFREVFLREYPWAKSFKHFETPYYHHDGWTRSTSRGQRLPASILVTNDSYLQESSGQDCSIDTSVGISLPARWIYERMGLVPTLQDGAYQDRRGKTVAMDPSTTQGRGPSTLLVWHGDLRRLLISTRCEIVWIILAEKGLIGGSMGGRAFPGRTEFTGVAKIGADGQPRVFMKHSWIPGGAR